ncbi:MAG: hypothetical protein ABI759_13535, partial [Candidatus Solibacter sp.]
RAPHCAAPHPVRDVPNGRCSQRCIPFAPPTAPRRTRDTPFAPPAAARYPVPPSKDPHVASE